MSPCLKLLVFLAPQCGCARARTVAHRRPGELGAGELQSSETSIYETGEPGQVQMVPCFKLFSFIAQKCGSAHPRAHRRPGRNFLQALLVWFCDRLLVHLLWLFCPLLQGALQRCSAPTSQRCTAEGSRAMQRAADSRIADISLVPDKSPGPQPSWKPFSGGRITLWGQLISSK